MKSKYIPFSLNPTIEDVNRIVFTNWRNLGKCCVNGNRNKKIICMAFGLGGYEEKNCTEIARIFKLSTTGSMIIIRSFVRTLQREREKIRR